MRLTAGNRLGTCEILAPLGAGGMGEVYRARDTALGREVAVKVLPSDFAADPDRLRRFEQEAQAAAALNHPNILAIYHIGDEDGAPYIVSELLEGETLRDRLRAGSLPVRKAVDYAMQVANGLAAAHDKGIVHRDLKPENLFVTTDGRVKILDFGLAKLTRPEDSAPAGQHATVTAGTGAGMVLGTVGYMSPEQVRAQPVDARTDIFSLGAILYEMVSGKRAFHGETPADTMSAILREEPPPLTAASAVVPPALERVVRHCLEKNPYERFQSARDLKFDLSEISSPSSTSSSGQIAGASARPSSSTIRADRAADDWGRAAGSRRRRGRMVGTRASRAATADVPSPDIPARDREHRAICAGREDDRLWRGMGRRAPGDVRRHCRQPGIAIARRAAQRCPRRLGLQRACAVTPDRPLVAPGGRHPRTRATPGRSGTARGDEQGGVRRLGSGRHDGRHARYRTWETASNTRSARLFTKRPGQSIRYGSRLTARWVAFQELVRGKSAIAVIDRTKQKKTLVDGWLEVSGLAWTAEGNEVWFAGKGEDSGWGIYGTTLSGTVRLILRFPGPVRLEDLAPDGDCWSIDSARSPGSDIWRQGHLRKRICPGWTRPRTLSCRQTGNGFCSVSWVKRRALKVPCTSARPMARPPFAWEPAARSPSRPTANGP